MTSAEVEPLVSIIIPCWNAEDFVGEAIESALAQTYSRTEVIVIDDGSTDRSLDVIRSFGERIRWESGPNRGGNVARNRGLGLASGTLIQFLDADDLLLPEKLASMVPVAVASPPSVVPICDWEELDEGIHRTIRLNQAAVEDAIAYCLHNQLQTASPLHRQARLEAIGGFDPTFRCSQERDLHLRLAARGIRFQHIPRVLVGVRRQPESVSSNYMKVLRQHERMFMRVFNDMTANGSMTKEYAEAFAEAIARDGRACLQRGEGALGRKYFRLAREISDAGAFRAYRQRGVRSAARLLGPAAAEWLIQTTHRAVASRAQ